MIASGDNDDNEDAAHAETILPGTYYGNVFGDKLPTADYWDFYYFAFQPGDRINVTTAVPLGAVWIVLNGGASDIIYASSLQYPTVIYQTSNETQGTGLYLGIGDVGSAPTDYSFTLTITPQNDAGSGKDAPGWFEGSVEVQEGITTGLVDGTSDVYIRQGYDIVDCYRFQAGPEDLINVGFSSASTNSSHIALVDEDGVELANITSLDNENNTLSHYLDSGSHDGWYYLKISQLSTYAPYSFHLDLSAQDEGGSGHDAPSDFEGAPVIAPGQNHGMMVGDDVSDYYSFVLPPGEIATVTLTSSNETTVTLYDQDHQMTATGQTVLGILDPLHFASGNESGDMVMFVNVSAKARTDYDLTLIMVPQDDAGSGFDANSTFDSRCRIGEGMSSGFVGNDDAKDIYRIDVVPSSILNITFSPFSLEPVQAALYDQEGVLVFSMQSEGGMNVSGRFCYNDLASTGEAFITVGPGWGFYKIWIDITMQNDIGSGGDAYSGTDYLANATPIPEGMFLGYLDSSGDTEDTYGIDVMMGQTLNLNVDPFGSMKLLLRNSTNTVVGMYESGSPGSPIMVSWEADGSGWVTINLISRAGYGEYSIMIDITGEPSVPSAPVLTWSPGIGEVILEWTAPANDGGSPIIGYSIYKIDALIRMAWYPMPSFSVSAEVTTFTDTEVEVGKEYRYAVVARNTNGMGEKSNSVIGRGLNETSDDDGDGVPNGVEVENDMDPLNPADADMDPDKDGYSNREESLVGSDIWNASSNPLDIDGDGMPNAWEEANGLDPFDPTDASEDPDKDGRTNIWEYNAGTDPQKNDEDDDDGSWAEGLLIAGCCIGLVVIILLVVLLLVVALRRRKEDGNGEE